MSRHCVGLLLVFGHLATGVAVGQEIRVRLIDIETSNPAKGLYVEMGAGRGKEALSKPAVPPSAVPTSWFPQPESTGSRTSIDGLARFSAPHGLLKIGEISMIKVVAIYSDGVDTRYVSCSDKAVFRTEEVLKYGVTVKNLGPWCTPTKGLDQVQAAPGDIVMFVRSMKGMPAAEIRVRLIDIETSKPVKGLEVLLRGFRSADSADLRLPTSVDGVARFSVPAPSSREIRDIGPLFVMGPSSTNDSDQPYAQCGDNPRWLQTEEVVRHGVTANNVKTLNPECRNKKALDEVAAAPGEIVMFVRHWTWRERITNWFYDFIRFHP